MKAKKVMNISLTPELEKLVQEKVKTGMYHSASEVIREGLRLLKERDMLLEIKRQELRQEIQQSIDNGESTSLNLQDIKARARKR